MFLCDVACRQSICYEAESPRSFSLGHWMRCKRPSVTIWMQAESPWEAVLHVHWRSLGLVEMQCPGKMQLRAIQSYSVKLWETSAKLFRSLCKWLRQSCVERLQFWCRCLVWPCFHVSICITNLVGDLCRSLWLMDRRSRRKLPPRPSEGKSKSVRRTRLKKVGADRSQWG